MGDFKTKMSCGLISRGKKHANKLRRKKYPVLKKNIAHDVQSVKSPISHSMGHGCKLLPLKSDFL